MIRKNSKIYIAGHKGMVGSSIKRNLILYGYKNILCTKKGKLNLLDQKKTFDFLKKNKPDLVILAAAKVGGIVENLRKKDKFLYENLQIQNNVIHGSFLAGVKNLFFLGSSCIYPKKSKQPMKESYLLKGPLEETNEGYAIAKIAGVKLCEYYNKYLGVNYKSFMPPNMYGPNDNYELNSSHFYAALLKKIYLSKINKKKYLEIWGTGNAKREIMFVDDLAKAIIFFINKKFKEPYLNVGTGEEYSIRWYANFLMKKIGTNLKIKYDKSKPDGMKRKCLDVKLAKNYGLNIKNNPSKSFDLTFKDFKKKFYENKK